MIMSDIKMTGTLDDKLKKVMAETGIDAE